MAWRDRIKEFKRVPAGKLRANPKNPAIHGDDQREAMRGVLAEIGFIDALIAREAKGGMYDLIDGHLRKDLSPDQKVPVLIVELTDDEADAALASHDPIGRLADRDPAVYASLLAEIDALDADFRHFLEREMPPGDDIGKEGLGDGQRGGPDGMDLRPHEHYDYVIVLARTTHDWNQLCELLSLPAISVGRGGMKKIGIGRAIPATKLLSLLENNGKPTHSDTESEASAEHKADAESSA